MKKQTVKEKLKRSIAASSAKVFMRSDFTRFGGYDQVGRELKELEKEGRLVKAGYGVYVKTRKSSISNSRVPASPLVEIGVEAMRKLGKRAEIGGTAARAYQSGETTQIPMSDVVTVAGARVSRKIGFNGRFVRFER